MLMFYIHPFALVGQFYYLVNYSFIKILLPRAVNPSGVWVDK